MLKQLLDTPYSIFLRDFEVNDSLSLFFEKNVKAYKKLQYYAASEDWQSLKSYAIECRGCAKSSLSIWLNNHEDLVYLDIRRKKSQEKLFSDFKKKLLDSELKKNDVSGIPSLSNPRLVWYSDLNLSKTDFKKLSKNKKVEAIAENLLPKPESTKTEKSDQKSIDTCIGLMTRSLLSIAHAEYNIFSLKAYRIYSIFELSEVLTEVRKGLEEAKNFIGEYHEFIEICQRRIYTSLVSDSNELTRQKVLLSIVSIEGNLIKFIRIQARLNALIGKLLELGQNTLSEEFGVLSAKAGQLTRESISTYAASYVLAANLAGVSFYEKANIFIHNAPELPFYAELKNGKNVEISKLNEEEEDSYVEVKGFIENVNVVKISDKNLVSRLELIDPSSKSKAFMAASYVHFKHSGLAKGCYCMASGKYKKSSVLNNGQPTVELEKLSIKTSLSKECWKIGFLDLASPYYSFKLGNLNLMSSIATHQDNLEPKGSFFGAGELLFSPIVVDN